MRSTVESIGADQAECQNWQLSILDAKERIGDNQEIPERHQAGSVSQAIAYQKCDGDLEHQGIDAVTETVSFDPRSSTD